MMMDAVKLVLYAGISLVLVACQENDDFNGVSVGPYKQVYPPTNLSVDQINCSPDPSQNMTCPLYVALLMSFGGAYISSGVIPAIQVALDQINSKPDLLPGYSLHYTLKDSQCERTTALDALHTEIIQPPTKIAVVGSGCSVATEPTAEISHYYNITQLSCVSSSSELSNRRRFPKHFQLSTSEISVVYGFFGVIKTFNWRKVAIITQDENLFTVIMTELKRLLLKINVQFTETRFETDIGIDRNPFTLDPDARIYVLSMYAGYAREVLCMAYNVNSGFHYPRNLFFVNGWYADKWWIGDTKQQEYLSKKYNNCTAAQRESLLQSTIAPITSGRTVLNYSTVADNGYTGDEVRSDYKSYINASSFNITENFLYQLCYDSTWMLAQALNNTLTDLENNATLQERLKGYLSGTGSKDFGLQHFTYDNDVLLDNIFNHLSDTNFNGLVGNISFNSNGSRRIDTVGLLQYRYGDDNILRAVPVATVLRKSDLNLTITLLEMNDTLWSEGVPYDGVPIEKIVSVHLWLTIIFSLFATCGIIFAATCIVINIYFREKKLIRLTSPNLNNLIGIGAIILYFNMYVFVVPTTNETAISVLCNLNPWLTSIGYSLCYGTIVAKMCRVYLIFHNPSLKKKGVKDWMLGLLVLCLVILDVVILAIYTTSEGFRGNLSAEKVPNKENEEDRIGALEETIRYFVYVCKSKQRYATLGVLYGYKSLLQIIALIFAVSIRKINIKGLNDAIFIIAAIYVTSIVTTVIVVATYTLIELINVYAVVFCLCFFIGTTVILGLVFIPPLVGLYRDPKGENVFEDSKNVDVSVQLSKMTEYSSESDTVVNLRKRIQVLEAELQKSKKIGYNTLNNGTETSPIKPIPIK